MGEWVNSSELLRLSFKKKMSKSSIVWFHLYGSDGMPYNGVSADKVSLPENPGVSDFRDAVKAKNADSLLKGISPANLIVYENKAAFDMKVRKISLIKGIAFGRRFCD